MLNLKYKAQESRKLLKMAQMCSKLHSVPVYRGILEQIFFSVIKKNPLAQLAQAKIELLSLVFLANRCAKGVGTAWHSPLLGARDLFYFFENFFAQNFHYTVYKIT